MATILTKDIITNAISAVDSYVKEATNLQGQLEGIMKGLIGTNFAGDAADGFQAFYNSQVKPAVVDNLTASQTSLMAGVKSILEGIDTQLMQTVDPQLGKANQNPGGQ